MVHRADRSQQVMGVIDVTEGAPGNLGVVVNVAIGIHNHDELRQRQQTRAPDRVHHLLGVLRVALLDAHDHAVVKDARDGQVVVDDLGHGHPDERQEDALGRLADRSVLLGWPADHDGLVDRTALHGHAFDSQRRERFHRCVEAGVVAEGTFGQAAAGFQPPLQHDLGLRGHLQRDGQAVDQVDPLAAQEAREQVLVDLGRQRGAGAVSDRGVAAEGNGHRQPLTSALGHRVVGVGVLVDLPVQAHGARVVLLQPVHPEVAVPGDGVLRVGQAQVEERPAIPGPRHHAGQLVQVDVRAPADDVLAGPVPHLLRRDAAQARQLPERLPEPAESRRYLGFEQPGNRVADVVEPVDAESPRHPPFGAEHVHGQWHDAPGGAVEDQGGPTLPNDPGHDLGGFQRRVDRYPDVPEISFALQRGKEVPDVRVRVGHAAILAAEGGSRRTLVGSGGQGGGSAAGGDWPELHASPALFQDCLPEECHHTGIFLGAHPLDQKSLHAVTASHPGPGDGGVSAPGSAEQRRVVQSSAAWCRVAQRGAEKRRVGLARSG